MAKRTSSSSWFVRAIAVRLECLLTFKIRQQLVDRIGLTNRKHDSLEPVDGVDLEVDVFCLHFLFEEVDGVDIVGHRLTELVNDECGTSEAIFGNLNLLSGF